MPSSSMKCTELNFYLSVSQLGAAWWVSRFYSLWGGCRERERGYPPFRANKKVQSSPVSASMPKLWMGIVFLNCQQLESRLPTFFLCVFTRCQVRVKQGTMTVWSPTRHIFVGSRLQAKPFQDAAKAVRVTMVLSAHSRYALLVGTSLPLKVHSRLQIKRNFQATSYL